MSMKRRHWIIAAAATAAVAAVAWWALQAAPRTLEVAQVTRGPQVQAQAAGSSAPPAIAGSSSRVSRSPTGVASSWRWRTSSSLR